MDGYNHVNGLVEQDETRPVRSRPNPILIAARCGLVDVVMCLSLISDLTSQLMPLLAIHLRAKCNGMMMSMDTYNPCSFTGRIRSDNRRIENCISKGNIAARAVLTEWLAKADERWLKTTCHMYGLALSPITASAYPLKQDNS